MMALATKMSPAMKAIKEYKRDFEELSSNETLVVFTVYTCQTRSDDHCLHMFAFG